MVFLKKIYHFLMAWFSAVVYKFPSREIFVLGVTGTKGKSTVLELIYSILENAGHKTAMISSVYINTGSGKEDNITENTMPGRFFMQRFLRKAVYSSCKYALIEVTSEGVSQNRHKFIDFDAACFLNLHPEHIESHGSYKKYRKAKVNFFSYVAKHSKKPKKQFFINQDDKESGYFTDAGAKKGKIFYFSKDQFIKTKLNNKKASLGIWFANDINLENAAAAVKFTESQGIAWEVIEKTLKSFKGFTGRLEVVKKTPFKVVIDYAHTPDSLELVYKYLSFKNKKKLICVFGSCGGGRDKWKREALGRIADKYCKQIILTNEDPYDEKPEDILEAIKTGISDKTKVQEIINRKKAIKKAIYSAKKGDIVITTGKGSERWIHITKGRKLPWNEKKAVEEAL